MEVSSQSPPLGPTELGNAATHYLKQNTRKGLKRRYEFVDIFMSGARAGEGQVATANTLYMCNITGAPTTVWNQIKNARSDVTNHINHFSNWRPMKFFF